MWATFLFLFMIIYSFQTSKGCEHDEEEQWSYSKSYKNGPPYWGSKYPACLGQQQSPVNIDTQNAVLDKNLEKLQLNNYTIPVTKSHIKNNGHTVEVTPQDDVNRYIVVNGSTYSLVQFHFHWGEESSSGSEHKVDGRGYTMEVHFVHRNDEGKLAVVGVFFQEVDHTNSRLKPLLKYLEKIAYKGQEEDINEKIKLLGFLDDGCTFYRYSGSLTTPSCDEIVTWTVCKNPKFIGVKQMEKFRKLYSVPEENHDQYKNCKITGNYRPLQDLNGRIISLSK